MFYQRLATVAPATALLLAAAAGQAQIAPPDPGGAPVALPVPAEAAPAPPPVPDSPCCTLPARTQIEIEFIDTVNSRTNATRDSFRFRLAEPLTIDGRVVVPAGTPGVGEVVHAARARIAGKAGELILAARYLEFNGTRIPLRSLRYGRSQGRDNSGAVTTVNVIAAATIPVVGMLAFMIAGGEVNIPAGTRANAQTGIELVLAPVE